MPAPASRLPLKPLLGLLLLDGLGLAALACGFFLNEGAPTGAAPSRLALALIALGVLAMALSLILVFKFARRSTPPSPRQRT